ncbi:integrase catalytic domain-containing protein [Trichonephila clavipes]|nr:integrase catalytic domain-containing protein [Trichonephila clavipes]
MCRCTLLLLIQAESFPKTGDSINGLLTVRDRSGLKRMNTKIIERDDSYAFYYPILLPSRHHIVNCLIRDYHLRVRDALAFKVTGVDLCGPLILKSKSKSWVVLFTCAVYPGVHLEWVMSISTECFIQAFSHFTAHRGRPSIVYSDNWTNFVGAPAGLKKVDW